MESQHRLSDERLDCCCGKKLHLKHVVITSVTRMISPMACLLYASIVTLLQLPEVTVELLIRTAKPKRESVLETKPDVLNHNMETVSVFIHKSDQTQSIPDL